jgi:hypothetical protein
LMSALKKSLETTPSRIGAKKGAKARKLLRTA